MFKTFIILKYFHIQTSAIKCKYPTMIVRIFLVSTRTHSISRYIHIQTLCVHKRNVLRILQHGTYHVVVRGGSHFCQSLKGGGSEVFLLKLTGGPTLFWEKYQNSPALPPPQEKMYLPLLVQNLGVVVCHDDLKKEKDNMCKWGREIWVCNNSIPLPTLLLPTPPAQSP